MGMLWVEIGVLVSVVFGFYVFASHWQRLLHHHSRALRALSQRLGALEEMEDPRFRRMVGDSTPSPLEQVYTFSFRISDRFWYETMAASEAQMRYVRAHGKFLGSVKIERWRCHITVSLSELLPQSQSAGWQTRSVDLYPENGAGATAALWELFLESPAKLHSPDARAAVELQLEDDSLVLRARKHQPALRVEGKPTNTKEQIVFEVPLDEARLAPFRIQEEVDEQGIAADPGEGEFEPVKPGMDSWLAFYQGGDATRSVDWQLCVRDLNRKAKRERWTAKQVF